MQEYSTYTGPSFSIGAVNASPAGSTLKEAARTYKFLRAGGGGKRKKKKGRLAACLGGLHVSASTRISPFFLFFSQTDFLSPPTNNPHHRSSSSIAPAPFDVQRHLISLRASLLCKETGDSSGLLLRRPPRSVTTTGRQLTSRVILISLAGPSISALYCAADVCINDLHHSFTARLAL